MTTSTRLATDLALNTLRAWANRDMNETHTGLVTGQLSWDAWAYLCELADEDALLDATNIIATTLLGSNYSLVLGGEVAVSRDYGLSVDFTMDGFPVVQAIECDDVATLAAPDADEILFIAEEEPVFLAEECDAWAGTIYPAGI